MQETPLPGVHMELRLESNPRLEIRDAIKKPGCHLIPNGDRGPKMLSGYVVGLLHNHGVGAV